LRKKNVDLECVDGRENGSGRLCACQVKKRRDIKEMYATKERAERGSE